VGVPIQSGDRFLGVLAATNLPGSAHPFTEQSLRLLSLFADQAAVAIENAQLFEQAQEEIAERKRAEQERELLLTQIQEQALQMQQIIDTVPEAVLLLGDLGQVLLTNPRGSRALATLAHASAGDELTHLGDRPLNELLTSPPRGLWHEVNAGNQIFEVIAQPLELGPRPAGWVLVIRNVTQERGIQQRQQQQERLAAVGQLAAGIAHDFNNIMSAIVLHAQVSLLAPDVPLEVQDRLTAVAVQAKRAGALIQQILDFSRRSVLERRPLDLLPVLKEEIQLLQRTLPENIDVGLLYEPGRYMINADLTRIQQVIMNLAVNARDAMPDGGELYLELQHIHVPNRKVAPLVEMEPGDWVRIKVTDTGVGIPDDVLPHIYEPFFTTKAPDRGSGLGLAQVYGIIKQHEGHIAAESEMGEGTAFTLYLPALIRLDTGGDSELSPSLPHGQGETVLVVEDDVGAREAMVSGLKILNYDVLEAENGLEALEIYRHHRQDITLVLTDLVMPEMGGKQLLHALRQRDPLIKVMIMTGHPMNDEGVSLKATGATGWLQKPVSLVQLAEAMAKVLKGS
jgi:signal transduction histidine kinase